MCGACGGDATEWEHRWRALDAELNPQSPPVPGDGDAPYVGLAAYGPEHAEWFHGRESLVTTLVERVTRQRFVALVGPSGAGKSSVLRAGLLPEVPKMGDWSALVVTPGAHPLRECAVRLAGKPDGAEFVLVVDQFEEVFTLCRDADERERFIAALLAAVDGPDSRCRVVLGLRADFYTHCAQHARLAAVLRTRRWWSGR